MQTDDSVLRLPRRRLLKASAGSIPVIATLVSRPVVGQCLSPSMSGSIATSIARAPVTCTGQQPSYWAGTNTWSSPYYANGSNATPFHSITITGLLGTTFSTHTMMYVLNHTTDSATCTLGGYIAAALLNAHTGRTPVLSETTVRNMWNAVGPAGSPGYYEPTAGVQWGAAQIVAYIKTTMV